MGYKIKWNEGWEKDLLRREIWIGGGGGGGYERVWEWDKVECDNLMCEISKDYI